MTTLEESFTRLLGRQPTDKERQDCYRARDALNLKNNDALWLLLMALGHYETLYSQVPYEIRAATQGTLAEAKAAAEAQVKACAEETKRDLAAAVAQTAEAVAKESARARMLKWAAACAATCAVCFTLVGWYAYRKGDAAGHDRGWAAGYHLARDEKAAAAWANTPEGHLAFGLAKAGSIRELATCEGQGWVQKKGVCLPMPVKGAVHGWLLPADQKMGR